MRPRERRRVYGEVLQRLWDGSSKVSYETFVEGLIDRRQRLRRGRRRDLPIPSAATYSRVWQDFCRRQNLRRPSPHRIKRALVDGLAEGAWDSEAPLEDSLPRAAQYLARTHIVPPATAILLRAMGWTDW